MRRFAVLVVVVGVLASLATPVHARRKVRTQIIESSIQVTRTGQQITGLSFDITAEKAKCIPGRAVEITAGPSQSLQQPFGSGTTDAQGHAALTGSAGRDWFFAIHVHKARLGNTRCKPAARFGQLD